MFMTTTSTNRYSKLLVFLCFLIVVFQINTLFAEETPQTQATLKVTNVTFKELLEFEESLRQRLASLEKLDRQNFDAQESKAEIKLTITEDLQQFASDLALTEFISFEVEVLNQTAELIELRVNQRADGGQTENSKSKTLVKKPKVMILISERHWQASSPAIETEVIRKFTEKGYKVVDPNQIRRAHPSEPPAGLLHGDPAAAAAIGRQHGAELVIVGEAFTNDTLISYGLYTSRATTEIRMLDVDTATIFVAKSQTGSGSDLTQNMATQKAFQNAGELLADYLMKQIEDNWKKRGPKAYEVSLIVSELTFSQLVQLEQLLQNWRGIDAVNLRSFESGAAVIGVETQHSAQHLAGQLVTKPLNQFSLDVRNFNTMQIEIEVRRSVAIYDLQLVIANLGFDQLVMLQNALGKWNGVNTVFLRSFDAGVAVIELHYKGGAQRLAAELVRKQFGDFSLDVANFSTNRIYLEVKKKQTIAPIKLVISQISFDQLAELEQALKKWEGLSSVSLQGFDAGIAQIDLRSQHDAQHLAVELERKLINQFSLDVTNFTPNQINIEVKRASSVHDVQLIISPLAFDQLVKLKKVLIDWSGVDTVYLRSFDSGVAIIELHSENDTQRLAEELVSKPLNEFALDITNFTPNRINIEVKQEE